MLLSARRMFMQLSPNLKPIAVFIEYTLKPLIDDSRELLELLEKNGIKASDISSTAVKLFLFERIITFIMTIIVTGAICYTAFNILLLKT